MPTQTEERVHHPYSPSQLQSLEACSHYKGRSSQHERTIAGAIGHAVVETKRDDARLSDRDAVAAAACIDFVEQRKQQMQLDFPGGPVKELKEMYLPIDDLIFPDCKGTTAGYVDQVLLSWNETYAEMSDWKFGYWLVEVAKNNLQAIAYMLGLFRLYPKLQRIRFFFKLPNVDGFSETELTRDQIPIYYLRIQVVVARARKARESGNFEGASPTAPLCSFCANIADCPAIAALMINVAHKFWPLSIPASITPTDALSSRDTSMCLRLAAIAKTWAEAFRARVTDRVLRGAADLPEGHHIHASKGTRKVADVAKFVAVTLKYLPKAVYDTLVEPPSFGAVESAISEAAPRGSKESTVKKYAEALEAAGAVARGESFSYLKATNDREKGKAAQQKQDNTI